MHIDQIIRSRRKTLQISVAYDGRLIVRAPLGMSQSKIDTAVASKTDWIHKKQAQFRAAYPRWSPKKFIAGERFAYLGKEYSLKIMENQKEALILQEQFSLSRQYIKKAKTVFESWYRQQARRYLTQEVERLAVKHGFARPRIRITSARSRWGSCSSSGNLNLTWRLIMAPPEVIEYVIIHELAHLKAPGHQRPFWELVENLLPGYQKPKAWLKKFGHTLAL
jgi:hypothetical protein